MMDDPLSLLMQGIWLLAAGMYPLGFMLGSSCSPCCPQPCVFCNVAGGVWFKEFGPSAVYVEIEGQAWTVTATTFSQSIFSFILLCDAGVPSFNDSLVLPTDYRDYRWARAYFECISKTVLRVTVRVEWVSFHFGEPNCPGSCVREFVYELDPCDPGSEAVLVSDSDPSPCCGCLPCNNPSNCHTACCDFSGSVPTYVGMNPLP
jgi:hypothetical protein